jgi:hypothetical protein
VLIENMRREGFEVSISRPRVVYQTGENGERLEPIEDVVIDVDDEYTGIVIEKLSAQGRAEGHGPVGRRQDAHQPAGAVALADRLPGRVPDRHPRFGRSEPRVQPL